MTEEQIVARYAILSPYGEWRIKRQDRRIYSGVCSVCSEVFFTGYAKASGLYCGNSCSAKVQMKRRGNRRDRFINDTGYVMVRAYGHPRARKYGNHVPEHHIVMERVIGRYLAPGESVHHKNTIRTDNRPENLELWVGFGSQPSGGRVDDMIQYVVDNHIEKVEAKILVKNTIASAMNTLGKYGTLNPTVTQKDIDTLKEK